MGGSLRGALYVGIVAVAAAICTPSTLSAQPAALVQQNRGGGDSADGGGGAPAQRAEFRIGRASAPVSIDGRLDPAEWAGAVRIPLPWEVSPAENVPAPVATDCRMSYDDDNLYLGCTATDPRADAIRAYVVDRDRIDGHDRIVLTIDPFNDQRRAFQFGVSALGVQSDAVLSQGSGNMNQGNGSMQVDTSWDAIWRSAGAITDDGYVVEAAIPFRSLRFPRLQGDRGERAWGLYLTRWWPRSSVVQTRSAAWDQDDSCLLCQAYAAYGIEGGRPGVDVQLTPTLTASRAESRGGLPTAPLTAEPTDGEAGLDAQWGLTSDLTLNATLNPDFSQVEADAAQLDVNTRFALFFPEKRPFFLEGADFFATPIQAVFTRSVADPIAGAKLTGKVGRSGLGVMVARDRANELLIPGSQSSASSTAPGGVTTAVARFRRDVLGSSTIGALLTTREGDGYHNRVGGVDAFWRPWSSVTVQAQGLRSDTEYPSGIAQAHGQPTGSFAGHAARTNARWSTSDWSVYAEGRVYEPDFRTDAGFLFQSGVRGGNVDLMRRFRGGRDRWFTEVRLESGAWRTEDFDGNPLNGGLWLGFNYDGPGQTRVGIWPNVLMSEHLEGTTYEGMNQLWFFVGAAPSGAVSLGLNGNLGDALDFANARLGHELRLSPNVSARVGRNFEASLEHTWQQLDYASARVFTANLVQLRAVYSFSPRSFVRAILQHRRTERDPALHVDPVERRSTSVLTQLLYAYKVDPQTVFFLGWGQSGAGLTEADGARVPTTTLGRTLFLKLSWAWRP
jgi:hypothetical protein